MAHLDMHIPLRWTDLDAYGHVNNAATVRLLEEARIEAFWRPSEEEIALGAPDRPTAIPAFGVDGPSMTFVASQRLDYVRPIPYRREGVVVRMWISRFGGASMDVDYVILPRAVAQASADAATGSAVDAAYVRARTVIVLVDRKNQTPMRLPDDARAELEPWSAEPLAFRS